MGKGSFRREPQVGKAAVSANHDALDWRNADVGEPELPARCAECKHRPCVCVPRNAQPVGACGSFGYCGSICGGTCNGEGDPR